MQEFTILNSFFGILTSLFVFIGIFPYLIGIRKKKIHPHVLSWIGWGMVATLGTWAMASEGFTWGVVVVGVNAVACFVFVVYSIIKKVGIWKASVYDFWIFILGFIGLVLWQASSNPDLAIVFAILADFSFGLLTLIKIYKNPYSETILPWIFSILAGASSLLAISYISFTEIAYPVYIAIYDVCLFAILLVMRKIKK